MSGGSTYQNHKPENRPEVLSQYVCKNFYRARHWIIVHGVRDQLSGINLGREHVTKS